MDGQPIPPVVDAAWLAGRLDQVVVADVRWYLDGRSGRAAYESGHLPGAVWVDLDQVLADPPSPERGRHPLPAAERFAAEMGALGVSDDDTVVAYDDCGGMAAGRLVWMLRVLDHPAALLDGGMASWPGALMTGVQPDRPAAQFTAVPWPAARLAQPDDLGGGDVLMVDARAPERFRGEVEPIDARPGHIPGALNVPYAGNLEAVTGCFRSPAELRARYEAHGIGAGDDVVVYCGSGVSACHDLLALERAGLGPGRLYPGSWSQWSADPSRPAEVGG